MMWICGQGLLRLAVKTNAPSPPSVASSCGAELECDRDNSRMVCAVQLSL